MNLEIVAYNIMLLKQDQDVCELLALTIDKELSDTKRKIWHANPVWFLDENPIVGYSKQKPGIRLMF